MPKRTEQESESQATASATTQGQVPARAQAQAQHEAQASTQAQAQHEAQVQAQDAAQVQPSAQTQAQTTKPAATPSVKESRVGNVSRICLLAAFCIFIAVMGALTLSNHVSYSKTEGRAYAQWPSIEDVVQGKLSLDDFCSTTTSAFTDQLYGRYYWIKTYHAFHLQSYSTGAVEGENGQLYRVPMTQKKDFDATREELTSISSELASVIDDCAAAGAKKFYVCSIPRKDAVMTEDLPSGYYSSDAYYEQCFEVVEDTVMQKSESGIATCMNVLDLFTAQENHELYLSTDHHINVRGGELLYQTIMADVAEAYASAKTYSLDENYEVSKASVYGSLSRLMGMSVIGSPEELCIRFLENLEYTRTDNGEASTEAITNWGVDSYEEAYMGADFGETVIENSSAEASSAPNVLLVGTSYTNVLESLFVPSCHYMVSVDYRHNETGKSIADYVAEYDIDYVIFIPSSSVDAFSSSQFEIQLGGLAGGEEADALE